MNQAAPFPIGGLEIGLFVVAGVMSLVALVLGIVICVKMFQNDQTALGVVSLLLMFCSGIGYLIVLIFGWMKSSEWKMKGLMVSYTICLLGSIIIGGAGYAIMLPKMIKAMNVEMQNNMELQGENLDDLVQPIEIGD